MLNLEVKGGSLRANKEKTMDTVSKYCSNFLVRGSYTCSGTMKIQASYYISTHDMEN